MTKSPSDYAQIKFRPGSDLERTLAARSSEQTDRAFSQMAKDDLRDYYQALSLCLPPFTYSERKVLIQALSGWHATLEDVDRLWIEVEALADLPAFVARLRDLSCFECWAIYNAVKHGLWGDLSRLGQ